MDLFSSLSQVKSGMETFLDGVVIGEIGENGESLWVYHEFEWLSTTLTFGSLIVIIVHVYLIPNSFFDCVWSSRLSLFSISFPRLGSK